jgi:hypothetical protein
MKTTKRLSIELQHREVTISVAGSPLHVQDGEPDAVNTTTVCPTCGSPWVTLVAPMGGAGSASIDHIRIALKQTRLHLQVSPAGQLQICRRSFEEIKEKL